MGCVYLYQGQQFKTKEALVSFLNNQQTFNETSFSSPTLKQSEQLNLFGPTSLKINKIFTPNGIRFKIRKALEIATGLNASLFMGNTRKLTMQQGENVRGVVKRINNWSFATLGKALIDFRNQDQIKFYNNNIELLSKQEWYDGTFESRPETTNQNKLCK